MEWSQRISDIARSECNMPVRWSIRPLLSGSQHCAYVQEADLEDQIDRENPDHDAPYVSAYQERRAGKSSYAVYYRTPDGTTMRLDGLTEDQCYEQFKVACAGFTNR